MAGWAAWLIAACWIAVAVLSILSARTWRKTVETWKDRATTAEQSLSWLRSQGRVQRDAELTDAIHRATKAQAYATNAADLLAINESLLSDSKIQAVEYESDANDGPLGILNVRFIGDQRDVIKLTTLLTDWRAKNASWGAP